MEQPSGWTNMIYYYISGVSLIAVVKIDSTVTRRSVSTKNLNGLVKVYVYLPRKSTKYSDHVNLVGITSSFTFLLHYIITVTVHEFSTINHECSIMKWLLATAGYLSDMDR